MTNNRLRKLREETKLNIRDAAEKLGVGKNTLSNYERWNGKEGSPPKADFLERASKFYNVSVDYLLGRTDVRFDPNTKIKQAIEDDPELYHFWDELSQRDDLQLLFKQTRDLPPEAIRDVINIIRRIEKDAYKRHN